MHWSLQPQCISSLAAHSRQVNKGIPQIPGGRQRESSSWCEDKLRWTPHLKWENSAIFRVPRLIHREWARNFFESQNSYTEGKVGNFPSPTANINRHGSYIQGDNQSDKGESSKFPKSHSSYISISILFLRGRPITRAPQRYYKIYEVVIYTSHGIVLTIDLHTIHTFTHKCMYIHLHIHTF